MLLSNWWLLGEKRGSELIVSHVVIKYSEYFMLVSKGQRLFWCYRTKFWITAWFVSRTPSKLRNIPDWWKTFLLIHKKIITNICSTIFAYYFYVLLLKYYLVCCYVGLPPVVCTCTSSVISLSLLSVFSLSLSKTKSIVIDYDVI